MNRPHIFSKTQILLSRGLLLSTFSLSILVGVILMGSLFVTTQAQSTTDVLINPSGGNVGIGTNSPGRTLHLASTADTYIRFTNGDNNLAEIGYDAGTDGLEFRAGDVLFLGDNGNVGIGTTSPGASLEIKGSPTNDSLLRLTEAAAGGKSFEWRVGTSGMAIHDVDNNQNMMTIINRDVCIGSGC